VPAALESHAACGVLRAWLAAVDDDAGVAAFYAKFHGSWPKGGPPLDKLRDDFAQIRDETAGFVPRHIVDESSCAVAAQKRSDGLWSKLELPKQAPAGLYDWFPMLPEGEDAPAPRDDVDRVQKIGAFIDALAARDRFSGTIVIVHRGKVLVENAWGLASRAWSAPVRLDTRFSLGSINKMFTAVSILQLTEKGKVSLDDTVGKWLPDWPNADVREKATVRMLLTHSSGLGSYWNDEFEKRKLKIRAPADYFPTFSQEPLQFAPGARFGYSNAGFIVLGAIVEKASGEDYFEYVRRHVFAPSNMSQTDWPDLSEDLPNHAVGYTHTAADRRPDLSRWHNNNAFFVVKGGPAGGGYSTSSDLVRFGEALVSAKLLRPETYAQMSARQIEIGDSGYGFGMGRYEARGTVFVGLSGRSPGFNAALNISQDGQWIFAVMTNTDYGAGAATAYLRDIVTRH